VIWWRARRGTNCFARQEKERLQFRRPKPYEGVRGETAVVLINHAQDQSQA